MQIIFNVLKELKEKFLSSRFSVRKRDYDSVSINWTGGSTEKAVRSVTGKYKDTYFYSMRDISVSRVSPFNWVYSEVGYLFTDRDYSDVMKQKAVDIISKKYASNLEVEEITLARFKSGKLYRVGRDYLWHSQRMQGEINRTLAELKPQLKREP